MLSYVLYGANYTGLVSLGQPTTDNILLRLPRKFKILHHARFFFPKKNGLLAESGFEMSFDIGSQHLAHWDQNTSLCVLISDPGALGAGAKTRLESSIGKFKPIHLWFLFYHPDTPSTL